MAVPYQPQGLAVIVLDSIPMLFLHPKTKKITTPLLGKKFMCRFPSGQLYFDSKLDLDTDGSTFHSQDGTGQGETSTKNPDGTSLDADQINYFVLPKNFFQQFKIQKGDIGVVVNGIRKVYACFGDVGPPTHLGEGSIALHRELGHETIKNWTSMGGGKLVNEGISSDVITIVFPGSGNGFGRTNKECAQIGEPLFQKLMLEAQSIGDFPASRMRAYA